MSIATRYASATKARLWAAEEVSYGVYETLLVNPVRIPVSSETLRESKAGGGVFHSIERGHAPAGSLPLGRSVIEGEIVTELCANGWGPLLLKHATSGQINTVVGESTREHTGTVGTLPVGLSLVKATPYQRGGGQYVQTFLGCRIDALTLRFARGRNVELRAQMLGRERVTSIPAVDDERYEPGDLSMPSRVFTVHMTRNGYSMESPGNILSAEFTIENGLGPERYEIEGNGRRSMVPQGRRVINGRMEALFSNADEELIATWLADRDVTIHISGQHAAAGSGVFAEFQFAAVKIRGTPIPQIAGRGLVRVDFTWQTIVDAMGDEFHWIVGNNESEVSTGLVSRA